jgi:hypothetical protein
MAFTLNTFSPIGGQSTRGGGNAIYSFKTVDAAATVDTTGYFNEIKGILNVGDLIYRTTFTDATYATLSTAGFHTIASISAAGVVDTTDTTVLTVTDTD